MRNYQQLLIYGVAIGSSAIAFLLSIWLEPLIFRTVGAFFYIAVIVSSWYGGFLAGMVTVVLSTVAIDYLFIPPQYQLGISQAIDVFRLGLFLLVALIINLLTSNFRNSTKKIKQLSQQLAQENAVQLRMALSAAQMGLWDWDMVTGEIKWSPEHEQLFGLTIGSFDGNHESFEIRLHPEDRLSLNQAIEQALQNHTTYQHEYRIIWADGSSHWIEGRGNAFYNEASQPVRMTGTVMNIDDRKLAQGKLEQQFEQQRLVIEMTQRIRQSLNLAEILQTTVDEVRQFLKCDRVIIFQFYPGWGGKVVVESVAPEWMPILPLKISDPCIGEENVEPFKRGLVTAKSDIYTSAISPCHVEFLASLQVRANLVVPVLLGDELWGLLTAHHCASPREWQSSEIQLLRQLGEQMSIAIQQAALFEQVQTELTERKQAETALQQLNAELEQRVVERTAQLAQTNDRLLETVFEQQQTQLILLEQAQLLDLAHDTIITRDLNGAISFWNEGAEFMYGWTKAEALGQISYIFLKTEFPQSLTEIESEFFEKGYWEGEIIHFSQDARPINLASRWVLQKDHAGKPIKILEINNDITERKLAEAALQKYVHEVEDLYNNAPCGYQSLDADGNFIRINDIRDI